jgi:hypothetical protein
MPIGMALPGSVAVGVLVGGALHAASATVKTSNANRFIQ